MRDRYQLLQEEWAGIDDHPWRMLVISITQQGVLWPVADQLLDEIFDTFHDPIMMDEDHLISDTAIFDDKDHYILYQILRGTSFSRQKTNRLIEMSRSYITYEKRYHGDYARFNIIKDFKGCGQYAQDTWDLFVLKKPCKPEHRLLIKYAKEHNLYKED